ncbi:UNVERIFIED_ORG: hypothetical protein J2W74_005204 [Methylorubrum zatmanii]
MGIFDWRLSASQNSNSDPSIRAARDGAAARDFSASFRGVMAAVKSAFQDQGGALVTSGTGNVYELTTSSGITTPEPGVSISFRANRTNTAEAVLAIDGTGPRRWLDVDGTALDAGEVRDGQFYTVAWIEDGAGGLPAWQTVGGASAALTKDVANAVPRNFFSPTSPFDTNAYDSVGPTGKAAMCVVSDDSSYGPGKERYGAWFAYTGEGSRDPSVIASSFALGVSNLKKNWFNTEVPGQTIGLHITTRGGYHGPLKATAPAEFGGYYPGGDVTNIIINSVQTSPYAQQAAAEMSIHYAENGRFEQSGNVHSMNVQIAPMKMLNPDGSAANPGIGIALTASAGSLSYAIQAVNTARPGSFNNGSPGIWGGFLRYNFDDGGTRPPFDAFRVDQDGSVHLSGGLGATPSKKLRAGSSGEFQVLSHAGTPILDLSDAGVLKVGAGAAAKQVQTVSGAWAAYGGALEFDAGSTAAGTFNGRFQIIGKTFYITVLYSVSAAGGTPGGALYIPLPSGQTVGVAAPGFGNEFATTGKGLTVRALGGAARLTVLNIDNTSPVVAGAQGQLTSIFELS